MIAISKCSLEYIQTKIHSKNLQSDKASVYLFYVGKAIHNCYFYICSLDLDFKSGENAHHRDQDLRKC